MPASRFRGLRIHALTTVRAGRIRRGVANDESCTVIYKLSESILANIFSVSASANGYDGDRTLLYFE